MTTQTRAFEPPATGVRGRRPSVLIVDDDESLAKVFARTLEAAEYEVRWERDGAEAKRALQTESFDVIVSDISMPGMTGIELLQAIRQRDLDVPVVLVTGEPEFETAVRAVEHGALRYLEKPVSPQVLQEVVARAAQLHELARIKRRALSLFRDGEREASDRARLETALSEVLRSLWMSFQPIAQLSPRMVFAYEALLRSSHATLPGPPSILEAAERLGRMHELGRTVRRRVAEAIPRVSDDVLLFVNLHPLDLEDDDLYSETAPLTEHARRVVLEVTERAHLEGVPDLARRVYRLHSLGYRLALDDFGAGYAGIKSFIDLNPEFVKIDMSLVRDLHRSEPKQKWVRSTLDICRGMGIRVVAEGVETGEEMRELVRLEADLLQGYFLARPGTDLPPVAPDAWEATMSSVPGITLGPRDAPDETEAIYRLLFDNLIHGFAIQEIICDERGKPCDFRILEVNRRWEEITGAKAEEVVGKTVRETFPEVEDYWIETLGNVALTGVPARLENYARALGKHLDLSIFSPRKGQFASVVIDVTEQKNTLEALRRTEARFRTVFEGAGVGMALVDLSGRFQDSNGALERMMGFTREELKRKTFADITHPEDLRRNLDVHTELVSGRSDHYTMEKRYVRKDGCEIWGRLNVSLVRDAAGRPDYCVGMVEDVTERKRAEEDLHRLNAELERRVLDRTAALASANRELSAFSYSVSHDLRAPLRHVTGFVNLLEQHAGTSMDDKARRYAGIIAESARRMGRLIDDLLEFSRTGRAELKSTEFDLMPLIQEVQRECLREAEGRDIRWKVAALPRVAGDRSLLRLVFVNLLGNALKFTRNREVAEIEIGLGPSEKDARVIFVRDNGAGFDPRYAGKLFGIFQRLHGAEEFGGTGIGLANVKRIVERHGGRVWAEGAVDEGAAFFVSLPDAGGFE